MSDTGTTAKFEALAMQDAEFGPGRAIAKHLALCAIERKATTEFIYKDFAEILEKISSKAKENGIEITVREGFRSATRQLLLYQQGRTEKGKIVTNAKDYQSYHQYGLAVDISVSGGENRATEEEMLEHVGRLAEEFGCVWGGSFGDPGHIEYHPGFTWRDLLKYFKTNVQ